MDRINERRKEFKRTQQYSTTDSRRKRNEDAARDSRNRSLQHLRQQAGPADGTLFTKEQVLETVRSLSEGDRQRFITSCGNLLRMLDWDHEFVNAALEAGAVPLLLAPLGVTPPDWTALASACRCVQKLLGGSAVEVSRQEHGSLRRGPLRALLTLLESVGDSFVQAAGGEELEQFAEVVETAARLLGGETERHWGMTVEDLQEERRQAGAAFTLAVRLFSPLAASLRAGRFGPPFVCPFVRLLSASLRKLAHSTSVLFGRGGIQGLLVSASASGAAGEGGLLLDGVDAEAVKRALAGLEGCMQWALEARHSQSDYGCRETDPLNLNLNFQMGGMQQPGSSSSSGGSPATWLSSRAPSRLLLAESLHAVSLLSASLVCSDPEAPPEAHEQSLEGPKRAVGPLSALLRRDGEAVTSTISLLVSILNSSLATMPQRQAASLEAAAVNLSLGEATPEWLAQTDSEEKCMTDVIVPVVRTMGNLTLIAATKPRDPSAPLTASDAFLLCCPPQPLQPHPLPVSTVGDLLSVSLEWPHAAVQREATLMCADAAAASEAGSPGYERLLSMFPLVCNCLENLHSSSDRREALRASLNLARAPPCPSSSSSSSQSTVEVFMKASDVAGGGRDDSVPIVRLIQRDRRSIDGVLHLLKQSRYDVEILWMCVLFLELVLKWWPEGRRYLLERDGIDALETVQFAEDEHLRHLVSVMIDRYFEEEEDEDLTDLRDAERDNEDTNGFGHQAAVPAGGFNFGPS
uniref:IBB domain-containing protein n=1 Tax=Chromera velia CCMP2878 TaxID=1169474 RepID=A0A0G4ICN0_9ALVE|eukprot:Cvel_2273.t1-p1 / transcript=Cvel_2273.t1 / gene=Cvel_2273 / organism=Chromera_velia_CCMP2878 / gene_product=hypothetical protein / transcript_product=hypothetical protein / location=Cvel_scaffold88:34722-41176(+) / protein_length=748 / sequence_SO=supercontig / SO=protein_coding / is_pseudo=false